jgi:hydrogenase maturation protease
MAPPARRDVTASTAARSVVIGVGNAFRRDDGVGEAVVCRLEAAGRFSGRARAVALDGEPARLVDAWDGAALAVIIDAVVDDAGAEPAPGTVRRTDVTPRDARAFADALVGPPTLSGHAAGVAEALALGACLDRLPRQLVIYTVVGADFGHGPGLSPAVEAAVDPLAGTIGALVGV